MPPLHHRDGGAVAACLGSDVAFGEIICDGFHIAPHMIRLAYSLLGYRRTVLISDSMQGTGCPDGDYSIAGMPVTVKDGKAYTSDGAIAGSTLGLLDAVRNLMCFCDIPAAHALLCATRNPARAAGIDHLLGELKVGLAADILVLRGDNLTMEHMFIGGNRIGGVCV
jgi:N-acetylglucosamine-6-phosphate deacetylase